MRKRKIRNDGAKQNHVLLIQMEAKVQLPIRHDAKQRSSTTAHMYVSSALHPCHPKASSHSPSKWFSCSRTSSIIININNARRVLTNSIPFRCVQNIDCVAVRCIGTHTHDFYFQSIDFCRLLAMRSECHSRAFTILLLFFSCQLRECERMLLGISTSTNAYLYSRSTTAPRQHSNRVEYMQSYSSSAFNVCWWRICLSIFSIASQI